VRLLRRRSEAPAEVAGATSADAPQVTDPLDPRRTPGKGKPTPRRREAERRRTGPVAPPPKTRREAYRRMREQGAERRAQTRAGMLSGDDRFLLPRDQGPERRLVRDIVDSRRNAGVLFLFVAVVYFLVLLVPDARVQALGISLWLSVLVLLVVDSIVLGLRIRRLVRERFPDTRQRMRTLVIYGITRATMIRRWRTPKPKVSVGDAV
jgi:cation transport ATPase